MDDLIKRKRDLQQEIDARMARRREVVRQYIKDHAEDPEIAELVKNNDRARHCYTELRDRLSEVQEECRKAARALDQAVDPHLPPELQLPAETDPAGRMAARAARRRMP